LPNSAPRHIKLATYNIHRGIGTDGIALPERILSVLEEMNADIIALQELELHSNAALSLLAYLARNTGLTPVAGPTVLKPESRYGNALLTRAPVVLTRRVDLTVPGREPRGALDMDLDWRGYTIHLVATHLGLNPAERRHQVRHLLELLEIGNANLTVLMGDINEWFLWGRPLRWLKHAFLLSPRRRTFPAGLPLFALDRIWVYPPSSLKRLETHDSALARAASDHLPLKALIEMP
jgi:endonuclease/exonuclease/phosphatase family metal-dependent hydrolase